MGQPRGAVTTGAADADAGFGRPPRRRHAANNKHDNKHDNIKKSGCENGGRDNGVS